MQRSKKTFHKVVPHFFKKKGTEKGILIKLKLLMFGNMSSITGRKGEKCRPSLQFAHSFRFIITLEAPITTVADNIHNFFS